MTTAISKRSRYRKAILEEAQFGQLDLGQTCKVLMTQTLMRAHSSGGTMVFARSLAVTRNAIIVEPGREMTVDW